MKKSAHIHGKPALDLVEEAVHELRRTPARLWLAYYTGTIPFVLGLLYFWADMRYGALAERHCAALALGVTGLFVWMHCWQTVFAAGIRERVAGQTPAAWNARRVARATLAQAVIQPSKLVLLPLAALTILPFPWMLAFYESVTVNGRGDQPVSLRELMRSAARQAGAWPGQNWLLALILLLLGGTLWLNAMVAVFSLPYLMKIVLGMDTVFTQSHLAVFNTTFFTTTLALAGLILDPLVKTVHTLRSFYSTARLDGADLLADLGLVRRNAGLLAVALIGLICWHSPAAAAEPPAAGTTPAPIVEAAPATTPAELEKALKSTLAEDKYTWRLPREKAAPTTDPKLGWLQAFFQSLGQTIREWLRAIYHWGRDVHRWFEKLFPRDQPAEPVPLKKGVSWMAWLRGMAYLLLILATGALVLLLWRYGRRAWHQRELVTAETLPPRPDLTDENVTASQLPEDEWLRLARELAGRGELRLALRAFYLASLAHLATRDLVSLARFKSNRDYQLELARRARARPELTRAFAENVAVFDCVWYGPYAVSRESLGRFQLNVERIRSC